MNRAVWKLAHFLASPELTDSEFKRIRMLLETGRGGEIVHLARAFRRDAARVGSARRAVPIGQSELPVLGGSDELVSRVGELLRDRAQLTVRESLTGLAATLGRPEFPERTSFRKGIEQLESEVGPGAVLSAAHRMLRLYESGNPPDWRLRE